MYELKYSVLLIDFRNYNSAEELQNFFTNVGLDMIGSSWYEAYLGNWIEGVKVNRVWVDAVTRCLIAYETDEQQMIYTGFAEYLNSLQPIDKTFEYGKIDFFHRKDVTIDSILDKILEKGANSLTKFEKSFLENNSQNE